MQPVFVRHTGEIIKGASRTYARQGLPQFGAKSIRKKGHYNVLERLSDPIANQKLLLSSLIGELADRRVVRAVMTISSERPG
jgi:hypothetical protein